MRRRLIAACSLALLPGGTAHAAAPPLSLGACRYLLPAQDQNPYDTGRHYAVMFSEPVVVGDGTATITCTFQLGPDYTHAGTNSVARTSPPTPGAVALPPVTAAFEVATRFSYCSEVSYEGGATYYWDADLGVWSTDPGVPCYVVDFGPPPEESKYAVAYFVDRVAGPYADPLLCPVLASSPLLRDHDAPVWVAPDGDVYAGGWQAWYC